MARSPAAPAEHHHGPEAYRGDHEPTERLQQVRGRCRGSAQGMDRVGPLYLVFIGCQRPPGSLVACAVVAAVAALLYV